MSSENYDPLKIIAYYEELFRCDDSNDFEISLNQLDDLAEAYYEQREYRKALYCYGVLQNAAERDYATNKGGNCRKNLINVIVKGICIEIEATKNVDNDKLNHLFKIVSDLPLEDIYVYDLTVLHQTLQSNVNCLVLLDYYKEIISFYQSVDAHNSNSPLLIAYIDILYRNGKIFLDLKKYNDARESLSQSVLYLSKLQIDFEKYGFFVNPYKLLFKISGELRDYEESILWAEKVLSTIDLFFENKELEILEDKMNWTFLLGTLYGKTGNFSSMEISYQEILKLKQKYNKDAICGYDSCLGGTEEKCHKCCELFGDLYRKIEQYDDAKVFYEKAIEVMKYNLFHDKSYSLRNELVLILLKLSYLNLRMWERMFHFGAEIDAISNFMEATKICEDILRNAIDISNDFCDSLTRLSYLYQEFHTTENTAPKKIVEMALIWSEMQLFLPKNLQENANEFELDDAQLLQKFEFDFNAAKTNLNSFWQSWLDNALNYNDNSFILDVVGALHGMYLQRILKANMLLDQKLEENQIEFIKLKKQLAQWQLEWRSGNRTEDEKKKLEENLAVQNLELQNLRKTLIEKGLYCDKDSLNDYKDVFKKLEPNQAVVICINFADYGLDEKKDPQFLIIKKNEHDSLNFQWLSLNQLSKNISETPNDWGIVYNSMSRGERLTTDTNAKLLSVKENMSAFWQSLKNTLGNEHNDVSFIAQGNLSGLPWQGLAPEGINVSYFSGLYAYKQRKTAAPNKPFYPTVDSPLAVLFNDAENNPEKRLYHLKAEIEAIKKIWGEQCVNELKNLSDSKGEHSLFVLLGHGDHLNGEAQFETSTGGIITQYDFLNHPYPIRFLAASCCVLGVEKNISGEPLGLMSVCGAKQSMEFSAGALIPIDDLLSVVLTILFHCNWKAKRNPTTAMNEALSQMKSGEWIDEAKTVFVDVFTDYLPKMFCDMYQDAMNSKRNSPVKWRTANIFNNWGINLQKEEKNKYLLIQNLKLVKVTNTKQLVENYLLDITSNPSSKNVETFCQCWAYG